MKSEELRIGNYYENNGIRRIEPHDIEFCYRNNISFNRLSKPIILTVDWLKDFKLIDEDYSRINFNNLAIEWKKTPMWLITDDHRLIRTIEFVHTFQNIWFDVMNEALVKK